MKSINEMSKEKLLKLVIKYYKDITNKKDLVNELLEHFELDMNSFSKNSIHKMIHNYYNQFSEQQLRKEINDNFDLELPKKNNEYEKEQIEEFEKNIPNDKKLVKPKEKKEIIKTFDTIENLVNKFVSKSKAREKVDYYGVDVVNSIAIHTLINKGKIECPIIGSITHQWFGKIKETELTKDIKDKVKKRLSNCIKNKAKIILIRLNFNGHANLAIIKPEKKEIIRFEPMLPNVKSEKMKRYEDNFNFGFDREIKELIDIIKDITGDNYKYIKPLQICPKMPVGLYDTKPKKDKPTSLQGIEESVEKPAQEGGGYCVMWSIFFGVLLLNNPQKTEQEVLTEAYKILGTDPQTFRHVIRGFWIDILDEAKEIAKTLKNKFDKSVYSNPYTYGKFVGDDVYEATNRILENAIDDRHKIVEKEKGGKLRSMYIHKSGLNLGYINKKHFKNIKCLCKSKQPKNKHCSCSM